MSERLTYGYSESLTEETPIVEPIDKSDVKAKLGIGFTAHDTEIERLIPAVREAVERRYSKSLTGKTVSVLWLAFYDELPLPYSPVNSITAVTDLDDVAISSSLYKVRTVGVDSLFVGDFSAGVKLTYTTTALEDNRINELLIETVGACLQLDLTIQEAIAKHFNGVHF